MSVRRRGGDVGEDSLDEDRVWIANNAEPKLFQLLDRPLDVNHGARPEAVLLGDELLDRGRHDVLDETNRCFPLRRIGRGDKDNLVSRNDAIVVEDDGARDLLFNPWDLRFIGKEEVAFNGVQEALL